ncbi:HlyD family efflux transporter periplasmic adaptor subunit [Slackia exigua]|uniref:efflux RND transporter periplasmic adaptor subunit n=1 Tax=Slackia exigua TaxID=84109 RepID=UPI003BA37242
MSKTIGKSLIVIALVAVLGVLVWGLAGGATPFMDKTQPQPDEQAAMQQTTATVQKGTIESKVTGPGEIKGSATAKLELDKKRYFKEFVPELNTRVEEDDELVDYTYGKPLKAPYDLVVTEKNVPKSKKAVTSDHYLQVTRVDTMNVDIAVSEADIAKIKEGQEVDVAIGGDENNVVKGTVESINQVGSYNASGSKYTVTVSIPNEDGNILIGMSANLSIKTGEAKDILTVPVSAVKTTDKGSTVSVVQEDGTTVEKNVTTGVSDGKIVEISGDVKEGDKVVLNEAGGSADGMDAATTGAGAAATN